MTPATATQMSKSEDTEITLGTGKMLGLFFGLVILCAVFFGRGYTMGRNSVKSAPELLPSPSTSSGTRSLGNKPSGTSSPAPESQAVQQQPAQPAANASSAPNTAAGTPQSQTPAPDQPPAHPGAGRCVQVEALSK